MSEETPFVPDNDDEAAVNGRQSAGRKEGRIGASTTTGKSRCRCWPML